MLWTKIPAARALLAECAANPPETRVAPYDFNETAVLYTGKLARDLRRIRDRHMEALLAEADRTGNYDAFNANCLLTVEIAVSAAVGDAKGRRIAA